MTTWPWFRLLATLLAVSAFPVTAAADDQSVMEVSGAYGAPVARFFFSVRQAPGIGNVLQMTDIAEGTVRLLRPEGEGFVGGPTLIETEPVMIEVSFTASSVQICFRDTGSCTQQTKVALRRQDVALDEQGNRLRGEVWLPPAPGKYPAVVLVQGSEDNDRHGMDPMPQVLASRGFIVLAYDKRGTGQSSGSWQDSGIENLASDLKALFTQVLVTHPEVRSGAAGAIGFSEGPWVAVEARRQGAAFDFLVSLSGGASTKGASLIEKEAARFREDGLAGAELEAALAVHRETVSDAAERVATASDPSGFDQRITYDPTEAWRSVREPVLWIGGEWDVLQDQVAAQGWLRRVLATSPQPVRDLALVVFPRANHALFDAPSDRPSDWQGMVGIKRYTPGYWPLLLNWLRDRTRSPTEDSAR